MEFPDLGMREGRGRKERKGQEEEGRETEERRKRERDGIIHLSAIRVYFLAKFSFPLPEVVVIEGIGRCTAV